MWEDKILRTEMQQPRPELNKPFNFLVRVVLVCCCRSKYLNFAKASHLCHSPY